MENNISLKGKELLDNKIEELLQTRELNFLEFSRKSMKIIKEITVKYPESEWIEAIERIISKFDVTKQTYLIVKLKGKIKNINNYSRFADMATEVYNQVDKM